MKIAQIGLGYWGKNLLRNFDSINAISVMCDKNDILLEQRKKEYPNIYATNSVSDIYKQDIDAVVIATPPSSHYDLIKQALNNNKHVFVEKPMTLAYENAEEVVRLAEQKKLVLMVGMVFLYNPIIKKIKQIIDSGQIGGVKYIQLRRINFGIIREDVDAWWNLAPHDISIIEYWTGEKISKISKHEIDITENHSSDLCHTIITTESGINGYIESSWISPIKKRDGFIVGTKGMIIYNDISKPNIIVNTNEVIDGKAVAGHEFGIEFPNKEPLKCECLDFINSIINSTSPKASGQNNLSIMRVLTELL